MLQYKPLKVISLGQTKSDNINRMITITHDFYLVIFSGWAIEMGLHLTADNINHYYIKRLSLYVTFKSFDLGMLSSVSTGNLLRNAALPPSSCC